jgi:hypothetical protein
MTTKKSSTSIYNVLYLCFSVNSNSYRCSGDLIQLLYAQSARSYATLERLYKSRRLTSNNVAYVNMKHFLLLFQNMNSSFN